MAQTLEYTEGTVSRTNDHGLQLVGRDGWLNVSRFANPAPALPPAGARIRLGMDTSGFVRTIETVDAGPGKTPPQGPRPASQRPVASGPVPTASDEFPPVEPPDFAEGFAGAEPVASMGGTSPSRELIITRLACLKAAAHIVAGTPSANAGMVLSVAETFETWAQRPTS
jgi:hypothetical protein